MHGEYKVPGGKLIVVDIEVEDGVLRHPRVAGDFFLEPDEASYAYLDDWVLDALGEMGIKAWYQPLNDIATDQGKIAGAAQKRIVGPDGGPGAVLHHVTMAYDIDADKMLSVLRTGREKLSDKGTKSAKKRVDPLRRQTGLEREAVIAGLIDSFRNRYGLTVGGVTDAEMSRARQLVDTKFTTPEWTARVP
ncbi:biotin/lipoate A/B protein ligase family protein [Streptomyces sp. NPDC059272]|uniref:lipoate--protein ligase family protein n=1 Tax=Streptomyces sp. NPDC059272 TaxID=3346800 RepID=UPI0036CEF03C